MAAKPRIKTETIACSSGGTAYLARPMGRGRFPCVLVIHERYGLVQHTRDVADRFAREGYVAAAPDLFFRHPDIASVNRGEGRCDVVDSDAVADMESALDAVAAAVKSADLSRLAVMGVCQSARYPLVLAAHRPVGACLVFYGAAQDREWATTKLFPIPLDHLIARIDCPVLGIFGEADHIIHVDDVLKFRGVLEAHRKSYQIHIVRDAPHGWLNDTMPGRFRKKDAARTWKLTLKFLKERLGTDSHRHTVSWEFESKTSPDYDFSKNVRLE